MKIKLLKKIRKDVYLYKMNNNYYIYHINMYIDARVSDDLTKALSELRTTRLYYARGLSSSRKIKLPY
jgi:hypothetical protein